MRYLAIGDTKTIKGEEHGYLTGVMYLAPANEARAAGHNVKNACPFASKECEKLCLFTAGRGAFDSVREARIKKSVELMTGRRWDEKPPADKLAILADDIRFLIRKAAREGLKPAVRLNGTSDYPVHNWGLMEFFPDVQFYDYTKDAARMREYLAGGLPKNYHLTFSRSEDNDIMAREFLNKGALVAMVFDEVPRTHAGRRVKDGDESDLTFTRGRGILGLKAKGKARKAAPGFVIQTRKAA